ncbi:LOW QUALITY PROTEIN: hypothetical protein ACHAW6_010932 [Cyclotella cf. meneghiniana]
MVDIAAGLGALGSAQAQFFTPLPHSEPNYSKCWVGGGLVIGKGKQQINKRTQDVYACRMNKIDDIPVFHISYHNFKVTTAPATPFADKLQITKPIVPTDKHH